jgi:hypothetical protein
LPRIFDARNRDVVSRGHASDPGFPDANTEVSFFSLVNIISVESCRVENIWCTTEYLNGSVADNVALDPKHNASHRPRVSQTGRRKEVFLSDL